MTNVLLLGDNEKAPYHPVNRIKKYVEAILKEHAVVTTTDDYSVLFSDLKQFDVIIIYSDRWDSQLDDTESKNLLDAIYDGGRMIVFHSGVSLASRSEIAGMMGTTYEGHPPATVLSYKAVGVHPISMDIEPFEIYEEAYQYTLSEDSKKEVFLTYTYENIQYPAGWTNEFGEGKVVCLQPGHDEIAFMHPSYQKIILNSLKWCMTSAK